MVLDGDDQCGRDSTEVAMTLRQLARKYAYALNLPLVPRHQPDPRYGDFVGARSAKVLAVLYPPVKKRGGRRG